MDTIITAGLAFAGALAGSLIAPFVNWGIEKRRNTFAYRRELIKQWRADIEINYESFPQFSSSASYAAIRPHLTKEAIAKLEERVFHAGAQLGRAGDPMRHLLLDEVARIEWKWKLV
jgi:hypothetical protein